MILMDSHDKVNGKGKNPYGCRNRNFLNFGRRMQRFKQRFSLSMRKTSLFDSEMGRKQRFGFIDQDFKPTKISNELASQFVHQIRSEETCYFGGNSNRFE